ncbi:hypothetical protein FVEG_01110 [Fusarium verticillioides 7600]|uniref:Uncharacterized protein n=1 Tax=Gibberella moniliformis (strain M3125 / FGSC 7600) TaxID=334819 RepID=W7LPY6_GIBM7|nr:hypothetical protein FVEG_01110 [Fusarium verticillioides 7600]EWG37524.1 hypothetical protein FVEG_01110 [Fusarium verticillioides 7600]
MAIHVGCPEAERRQAINVKGCLTRFLSMGTQSFDEDAETLFVTQIPGKMAEWPLIRGPSHWRLSGCVDGCARNKGLLPRSRESLSHGLTAVDHGFWLSAN